MDIESLLSDALLTYVQTIADNDVTHGRVTIYCHHNGFALASENFAVLHRNGMDRVIVTGDAFEALEWARDHFLTEPLIDAVAAEKVWTDDEVHVVKNIGQYRDKRDQLDTPFRSFHAPILG